MKLALLTTLVLTGCGIMGGDPILYDGSRHVVVYCDQAQEHIQYLEDELNQPRSPEFVRNAKTMLWNIKFSCPANT